MLRPLLLALLGLGLTGCSSNQSGKSADTPAPPPSAPAAAPAPTAVKAAAPAETPKPAPVQKKSEPAAKPETGSPMDRFAKCLTDKGAVMYGMFWCDHCREQKEKFGDSVKYIHYVECVTPEAPRTPTAECKAQGIKHTPTWIFADGEHVEGVMGLDQLAMKTHCKMP